MTVAENSLPEYLLKVHAFDKDFGANGELEFRLENDHQQLFRLNPSTGVLTLTRAFDFELENFYRLKIDVSDRAVHPLRDSAIVNVFILDQNDNPPSIELKFNSILQSNVDGTTAFVPESFDVELPLAFVQVEDRDSGENGKVSKEEERNILF